MQMFDIKALEKEVQSELADLYKEEAKGKVKEHLGRIRKAEKVLENLRLEYKVMLSDLAM